MIDLAIIYSSRIFNGHHKMKTVYTHLRTFIKNCNWQLPLLQLALITSQESKEVVMLSTRYMILCSVNKSYTDQKSSSLMFWMKMKTKRVSIRIFLATSSNIESTYIVGLQVQIKIQVENELYYCICVYKDRKEIQCKQTHFKRTLRIL